MLNSLVYLLVNTLRCGYQRQFRQRESLFCCWRNWLRPLENFIPLLVHKMSQ